MIRKNTPAHKSRGVNVSERRNYTPDQIMTAFRKKMYRDYEARQEAKRAEAEANEIPNVKIISEVKIR